MTDCHKLPGYDTEDCCPVCHGANFYDDDVTYPVEFKDGSMHELCGSAARFAVLAGLADEDVLLDFHCAGSI